MVTVIAIDAFGWLFFIKLILLLPVKITEVSTDYHNTQCEDMPDTEDKFDRILISNNILGFIV